MSRQSHGTRCSVTALGNCVWGTTCSAQLTAAACAALVVRPHVCCTVTESHAGAWQCSSTTENPLLGLHGRPDFLQSALCPAEAQQFSAFLPHDDPESLFRRRSSRLHVGFADQQHNGLIPGPRTSDTSRGEVHVRRTARADLWLSTLLRRCQGSLRGSVTRLQIDAGLKSPA